MDTLKAPMCVAPGACSRNSVKRAMSGSFSARGATAFGRGGKLGLSGGRRHRGGQ